MKPPLPDLEGNVGSRVPRIDVSSQNQAPGDLESVHSEHSRRRSPADLAWQLHEAQERNEMLQTQNAMLKSVSRQYQAMDMLLSGQEITNDDAATMLVSNLRWQVEALEDDRRDYMKSIKRLEAKVEELLSLKDAYECKIGALESVLHDQQSAVCKPKSSESSQDATESLSSSEGDLLTTFPVSVSFQAATTEEDVTEAAAEARDPSFSFL